MVDKEEEEENIIVRCLMKKNLTLLAYIKSGMSLR